MTIAQREALPSRTDPVTGFSRADLPPIFLTDCLRRADQEAGTFVSLLMLAVVALFPVVLLALLLITSGLEGRVVDDPKVGAGERPGTPE
jgi:hypothetical protein